MGSLSTERLILHECFHSLGCTSKKIDLLVSKVSLLAMSQSEIFPDSAFTVFPVSSVTLRFGWEKKRLVSSAN